MFYRIFPVRIRLLKLHVLLHSDTDELIPVECGKILFDAAPTDRKIYIPIKGGHGSPDIQPEQLLDLLRFCDIPDMTIPSPEVLAEITSNLKTVSERHGKSLR